MLRVVFGFRTADRKASVPHVLYVGHDPREAQAAVEASGPEFLRHEMVQAAMAMKMRRKSGIPPSRADNRPSNGSAPESPTRQEGALAAASAPNTPQSQAAASADAAAIPQSEASDAGPSLSLDEEPAPKPTGKKR